MCQYLTLFSHYGKRCRGISVSNVTSMKTTVIAFPVLADIYESLTNHASHISTKFVHIASPMGKRRQK